MFFSGIDKRPVIELPPPQHQDFAPSVPVAMAQGNIGSSIVTAAARIDRRSFLAAGGALVIGLSCAAPRGRAQSAAGQALNAWVRVGADDRVTIILSQSEIGQGISTT